MTVIVSKALRNDLLKRASEARKRTHQKLIRMLIRRGATETQARSYLKRVMKR